MIPILLSLTSCGQKEAKREKRALQVVPVTTVVAAAEEVPLRIEATGSFAAIESSDVSPQIAGRVVSTPVGIGTFVQKGQPLVHLDSSEAELQVRQAQASVAQAIAVLRQARSGIGISADSQFQAQRVPEVQAARAKWEATQAEAKNAEAEAERYRSLLSTGDVSRSAYEKARTSAETAQASAAAARREYEAALNRAQQSYQGVRNAEAGIQAAQAALNLAKKNLADHTVRAPFPGSVTARPVSAGEWVTNSQSVATVAILEPVKLELPLREQEAGRVKAGMRVVAQVDAYPNRDFGGTLTAINAAVDPQSRTFLVEARFANPDHALRPGMFATASILLKATEPAVFVPPAALITQTETDSSQVYVIENGTARVRVVQVGQRTRDGRVRVISGLNGGERLAVTNLGQLFDGAPVRAQAS